MVNSCLVGYVLPNVQAMPGPHETTPGTAMQLNEWAHLDG
jgi:hypothetical protein